MKGRLISLIILLAGIGALPRCGAFQVTLLPASQVYDPDTAAMDQRLGFSGGDLLREDFEHEALIPEIKSNLKGRWTGESENGPNTWDGQWASSPSDDAATFTIQIPAIRRFGIGIGDNDFGGNEELSINGGAPIQLNGLPGHVSNGQGRAFYLEIQSEPNDPDIRSVRVAKGFTLRFDHLILERGPGSLANGRLSQPPTLSSIPARDNQGVEEPKQSLRPQRQPHPAPNSDARSKGVALLSRAGKRYTGDQLRSFFVSPDGSISTGKPEWIYLYHTEGKPYCLHGQVSLGGASAEMLFPEDLPDGFALFIREWSGMQRYSLTSRGVDVKRRLYQGEKTDSILRIETFDQPAMDKWIPFYVDVGWDRIAFFFGDQGTAVQGPLDTDGANKIVIAPGTKLKDLRLEVFDTP